MMNTANIPQTSMFKLTLACKNVKKNNRNRLFFCFWYEIQFKPLTLERDV